MIGTALKALAGNTVGVVAVGGHAQTGNIAAHGIDDLRVIGQPPLNDVLIDIHWKSSPTE